MMGGNPNWWAMHESSSSSSSQFSSSVYGGGSSMDSSTVLFDDHFQVRSWSHFLLNSGGGNEDESIREDPPCGGYSFIDVKQELARSTGQNLYQSDDFIASEVSWSIPSPSCVGENNVFEFSPMSISMDHQGNREHSSQCIKDSVGVSKKAKLHNSSAPPVLRVRKEKLGERITALHQLVSPFGKTDTASVLSEAIVSIRFLQQQIEALSSPYMRKQQHSDRTNNNNVFIQQFDQEDLKSRGLCLIPISYTRNVGNGGRENGPDYWPPSYLGGGY